MKKITPWFVYSLLILCTNSVIAQNVWTQHNDQGRTGWYPYETTLNKGNVNKNTFGLSFSHITDDKIVAQPLIVLKVNIPNVGIKNVVFVATVNNTVYAYDADGNADAYWSKNYTGKTGGPTDCSTCRPALKYDMHPSLCGGGYGDFSLNIGIVGTPVIDTLGGTMYFVTKIVNTNDGAIDNHTFVPGKKDEYSYTTTGFHQYLHAVDITNGNERPNSPVEITAIITGTGDGKDATNKILFDPRRQFDRSGLALSNGIVYIAFASHCDFNPSHGWVLSYNASTLAPLHAFNATPNDGRGGIWMSGSAPAIDENGNLYFTTGNSLNEDGTSSEHNIYNTSPIDLANRGESVIKLNPDLTHSDHFTPFNYKALNDADKDFGTQVMLIPNTSLAMTGCKDGNLYLMDKTNLGGYNLTTNNVLQTIHINDFATMHSSFAYFGGTTAQVYQFSENSQLKSYGINGNQLAESGTNTVIQGPVGASGAYLSVSSNGSDPATGLLWAIHAVNGCNANQSSCPGVLRAVNASDVTNELWNSEITAVDKISYFNKMTWPTIALGKVYVAGNNNALLVYGLKTNTTCVNNVALNKPIFKVGTTDNSSSNPASCCNAQYVNDGNMATRWAGNGQIDDSIVIDLGARYDICKIALTWEKGGFASGYDLKVSDDGINWITVNSVRGNTSLYTEFNSTCSGRYVNMRGITEGGGFGYSLFEFQIYGNPASSCPTPTGLTATTLSSNSEKISWNSSFGANGYLINYRPDNSASWISRSVSTNSITLSPLSCGSLYGYNVQATCVAANSSFSPGSFTQSGCPASSCDILPTREFNVDIGDIGLSGSVCLLGNVYSLSGSGNDIGGTSDEFQYVYKTVNLTGDYEVSGRIINQDQISANNKLGFMIRDSNSVTSRFAYLASVSNGNQIVFEYRDVPEGPVTTIQLGGHTLPYWLKLNNVGSQYTAFTSTDGINWIKMGNPVDLHFGADPSKPPPVYGMAITSADNTRLSIGKMDNFSVTASTLLPIRLLSFTARSVGKDHVLVAWSTSLEQHIDHFEVQRSIDNNLFQTIEHVKAAGESENIQFYSVNDNHPADGINFYRLKEVDTDGKSYFYPVVSVQFGEQEGLDIYPNPASAYTNIISHKEQILQVTVFDVAGKAINNIHYSSGQTTVKLNTASLAQGTYIITVKTTSKTFRQKLSRQ